MRKLKTAFFFFSRELINVCCEFKEFVSKNFNFNRYTTNRLKLSSRVRIFNLSFIVFGIRIVIYIYGVSSVLIHALFQKMFHTKLVFQGEMCFKFIIISAYFSILFVLLYIYVDVYKKIYVQQWPVFKSGIPLLLNSTTPAAPLPQSNLEVM